MTARLATLIATADNTLRATDFRAANEFAARAQLIATGTEADEITTMISAFNARHR